MAGPLDITPDRLAAEAAAFQQKLVAGLDTLREVDDVDYGATDKEEVWRDGKVVLYRYRGEGKPTAKVPDRKSDVEGKSVSVRVEHGGRRSIKKKKERQNKI